MKTETAIPCACVRVSRVFGCKLVVWRLESGDEISEYLATDAVEPVEGDKGLAVRKTGFLGVSTWGVER